ncbi:MAG: hypothetical protein LBL83_03570 [Clostridiales bacterium]|nr:hypothetical protein [Clostridiales bacterium]
MRMILPTKKPPITAYSHLASLFSIFWTDRARVLPWICDHFLLTGFYLSGRWVKLFNGPSFSSNYLDTPYTRNIELDRRISSPCMERFSEFVELCLQNRCYVFACLDNYYLPCSPYYLKEHYIHQSFIYGFDSDEKTVHIADYYSQKYARAEISYSDLNRGYSEIGLDDDSPAHYRDIALCQFVPDAEYQPNLNLLRDTLAKYLRGKDGNQETELSIVYGVECYRAMAEDAANDGRVDIRAYQMLYDHKVLMRHRLEYFREQIGRWGKIDLAGKNERLIEEAFLLRNLVIKYLLSKHERLLREISERCLSLMEADRQFTEAFLEFVHSELNVSQP